MPKARELNRRQPRMESSDTEDVITEIDTTSAAPPLKGAEVPWAAKTKEEKDKKEEKCT